MRTTTDIAPAPWQLSGHGYLLLMRCTQRFGNFCAHDLPGLKGHALGGLGALMLIDYTNSNVGPYKELLLSPGRFRFGNRRAAAITQIWVSTERSVVNGRRNWGLPKQKATFETLTDRSNPQAFSIACGDRPALRLEFSSHGPSLPVTTALLPRRWRTLVQPWQQCRYETAIRAAGRVRLARLRHHHVPADSGFPNFSTQRILPGLAAATFDLCFLAANITDGRAGTRSPTADRSR